MVKLHDFINGHWYSKKLTWFSALLWPISLVFSAIAKMRKRSQLKVLNGQPQVSVPIIVIGNISVGGVGKTPLVETIVRQLRKEGYRPGIVSRGYGGKSNVYPLDVEEHIDINACGDEPYMLQQSLNCPVVVSPVRVDAVQYMADKHPTVDVILSDDGLQHYKMFRDIEIVVIDASRSLGNKLTLPAGPLREPESRLNEVDYVIMNGGPTGFDHGYEMQIRVGDLVHLLTGKRIEANALKKRKVHAVAGIGNPERFFISLRELGYSIVEHAFPDHHSYVKEDFQFGEELPIIMTHKDTVKCLQFMTDDMYYLSIDADVDIAFWEKLFADLKALK